jgi:hypothetical protein
VMLAGTRAASASAAAGDEHVPSLASRMKGSFLGPLVADALALVRRTRPLLRVLYYAPSAARPASLRRAGSRWRPKPNQTRQRLLRPTAGTLCANAGTRPLPSHLARLRPRTTSTTPPRSNSSTGRSTGTTRRARRRAARRTAWAGGNGTSTAATATARPRARASRPTTAVRNARACVPTLRLVQPDGASRIRPATHLRGLGRRSGDN